MPRMIRSCVVAGFVLALVLASGAAMAQDQPGQRGQRGMRGGGQFDPAQFQQRMMEGLREQLGATDEAEWKVIEPLLSPVMQKRMDAQRSRMRMGMFGRGGNRGGGPGGPGGGRGGFMGEPSAEQTALQTALESPNSKTADIKSAMKSLRDSRKKQEAELSKACDDLKKVLSARQEAQLVLMGILD